MPEKNEVTVSFGDMLGDKLKSAEVALAKGQNITRIQQNAIAFMNDPSNVALQKCTKPSLIMAFLKSAYLGLDIMNHEGYIIAYGNQAQFQTSYIGEIKFTKKYSIRPIQDIYAKVIKEGDTFEETIVDGHPSINFKPLPLNTGKIMGVFAVCLFKDGGMQYEVMTTEDVQNVRNNYSKASQSKAWKNSFEEMSKKTVLRRLCKHIECDFESVEARQAWDESSDSNVVQQQKSDEVIDVFANKSNSNANDVHTSVDNPVIIDDLVEEDGK